MKNLLHIGLPKMGSKYIQRQLFALYGDIHHLGVAIAGDDIGYVNRKVGSFIEHNLMRSRAEYFWAGTLIQMDPTVAHDCSIGDEVNVNPGARIKGGVSIGNRVLIGGQSCIREGVRIADEETVGMGAVVVKNIL